MIAHPEKALFPLAITILLMSGGAGKLQAQNCCAQNSPMRQIVCNIGGCQSSTTVQTCQPPFPGTQGFSEDSFFKLCCGQNFASFFITGLCFNVSPVRASQPGPDALAHARPVYVHSCSGGYVLITLPPHA